MIMKIKFKIGDFVKLDKGYGTIVDFRKKKCGFPWCKVWDENQPVVELQFDRMARRVLSKEIHITETALTLWDKKQIEEFNP